MTTPFLPLTAVSTETPDLQVAEERRLVGRAVTNASLIYSAGTLTHSDEQHGGAGGVAGKKTFTLQLQVVPDSMPKQIFTLIADRISKRFFLEQNIYIAAVDRISLRLRSSTF